MLAFNFIRMASKRRLNIEVTHEEHSSNIVDDSLAKQGLHRSLILLLGCSSANLHLPTIISLSMCLYLKLRHNYLSCSLCEPLIIFLTLFKLPKKKVSNKNILLAKKLSFFF